MKILFICSGNTCRSPLIHAMFEEYLSEQNFDAVVDSAGLSCSYGEQPNPNTTAIIEERGLFFTHTSSPATQKLLDESSIIITMTDEQKEMIGPYTDKSKVYSFKDICGVEVPDPYGQGMEAYKKIEAMFEANLNKIFKIVKSKKQEN